MQWFIKKTEKSNIYSMYMSALHKCKILWKIDKFCRNRIYETIAPVAHLKWQV